MASEVVLDEAFGKAFFAERKRRKMTQAQVNAETGLSTFHLYEIEKGITRASNRERAQAFIDRATCSCTPPPAPTVAFQNVTVVTGNAHHEVIGLLVRATKVDDVIAILRIAFKAGITPEELTR